MDKKKIFPLLLGLMAVLFSMDAFAMMGHSRGGTRSEYHYGRGDLNHYQSYQQDHMNGYYSDHDGNYNNHMDGNPSDFDGRSYNGHTDQQHMYYEGNNPDDHMNENYYQRGDIRQGKSNRYRFKQEYSYEEY